MAGIESTMTSGLHPKAPKKKSGVWSTAKEGYAGYGTGKPGPGSPGGDAGYGGVKFKDTKAGTRWEGMPSFGGPSDPRYMPKTDAEQMAYRDKSGIAPTAKNMGSLAVQYRADEATAREGGGQSVGDKRAQKVIDTRTASADQRRKDQTRAKAAFKARYFSDRRDWASDKGGGPGAPTSPHVRSNMKPGAQQSARGLTSSMTKYGLF